MIKFVYFDVGGVALMDFSGTNKWEEMMAEIGIKEKDYERFDDYYHQLGGRQNIDLDMDSIMPDLEKRFGITFEKDYSLLRDGFVKKFERNIFIDPVIKVIKKKSGIGLLTNMYPRMFAEIEKEKLLPDIKWDVVVDSSIVKMQKPDKEIYEYAEKMCGYSGSQILFIDNTQKHLEGAKKLGWQTFLYDPKDLKLSNKNLLKYFRKYV